MACLWELQEVNDLIYVKKYGGNDMVAGVKIVFEMEEEEEEEKEVEDKEEEEEEEKEEK